VAYAAIPGDTVWGFLSVGWMLSVATGRMVPNVEEYYRLVASTFA
jgi:hypothetical protein